MRILMIFSLLIASMFTAAQSNDAASLVKSAHKLIVVTTSGWDDVNGEMQRYERKGKDWKPVGSQTQIVVGKNGLAWDDHFAHRQSGVGGVKKEGDGRSPAGFFRIARTFGFAPTASDNKFYLPLTPTTECVDDVKSKYYNQIVDRMNIKDVDWNSSEKMRQIEQYRLGAEVAYNAEHAPGRGSCIFLHIWSAPGKGTAGCTAMSEEDAQQVMRWLDDKTVLIQLPKAQYGALKKIYGLP